MSGKKEYDKNFHRDHDHGCDYNHDHNHSCECNCEKEEERESEERISECENAEREEIAEACGNETTTGETQALKEEIEKLQKSLEAEKSSANDFKDRWMRNVAEFDNYKKRNAKLWQDAFDQGKSDVILKILPIGDNLDMGLSMGLDEKTTEGLKLMRRKFDEVLSSLEVTEINPEGEPFDPNFSEAILQVEGEDGEQSQTVKQVFQKGYKCKDKIIRYAKVSVIK